MEAPHHQPSGRQLSTREANESRLVTKVRYEVEHANGIMKEVWKIFGITWESLSVPHLMQDFIIGAALYNRFYIVQREDVARSEDLALRMLALLPKEIFLARIVKSKTFHTALQKKYYAEMENLQIFPKLEIQDLKDISFGVYQIYQSKCYIIQHLKQNCNRFIVYQFKDETIKRCFQTYIDSNPILITMNLSSRFVSNSTWTPYVLFEPFASGKRAILEYCCNCKVGERTVGCCSHVMVILYYLGYSYKEEKNLKKAEHLKGIFQVNY